jgi:hypothetical protein
MNPSNKAPVYKWHSTKGKIVCLGGLACLAVSIICLFIIKDNESGGKWMLRIFGIIFGLGGTGLFLPVQTIVDTSNRSVRRELLFFGRWVLFSRSLPFSDFQTVAIHRTADPDQCWDTYFVSLRRLSGRKLWIRYWNIRHGSSCNEATELAECLSRDMGLPIDETDLQQTKIG